MKAKAIVQSMLGLFDMALIRRSSLEKINQHLAAVDDIELLKMLPAAHAENLINHLNNSKSQFRQDLFVLSQLNFKKNGYFVEFGATNGIDLSNTHLLEKQFAWTGILAEPARCWHNDLELNRSAVIEHDCVWKDSNSILTFNEADFPELSTINRYSNNDSHGWRRKRGKKYDVKSISLNDLLEKYHAPKIIDYLSIDTEGSEYDILSSFNFEKYTIRVITCEHNYTTMRTKIFGLLSEKGYTRKFVSLSKVDDWYVKESDISLIPPIG